MLSDAGLEIERVEYFEKTHETDAWLARTDCTGETAERASRAARAALRGRRPDVA